MNNRPANVDVTFAAEDELESSPDVQLPPRGRTFLTIVGLVTLVAITFVAFVPGQFIFTDHEDIVAHPAMHSWKEGLRTIWLYPRAMPQFGPLADTVLLVESRVFAARATAFRVVSGLIHAINVVLLWLLLRRLIGHGAIVAAALFAVLPVHAQTIPWASQQRVLLSATFYLVGLLGWARYPGRISWPVGAMTASILCHPMGLTFPLVAWTLRRSRRAMLLLAVAVATAAVLVISRVSFKLSLDWLYLPWAALIAGTVFGTARVMPQRGWRVGGAVAGVVVIGLAAVTALRAPSYRSDGAYWQAVLRRSPACAEALARLGEFDRALRIDPNHRGALLGLAAAHGAANEWDRAVARYQQLLARDPRDGDALFGLAVAYAQQDRTDDAIRAMQDVLRIHPDDARAHRELSVLYREAGDTSRALQHGERAMRLHPRQPEPYIELATLSLTRLGDVQRAQSLLQRAIRLDPLRAETFRIAGQAQFEVAKLQTDPTLRAEGFSHAIAFFRAGVRLAPNSAAAHRELGVALATAASQPSQPLQARLDLLHSAIFNFDRAAALDPSLGDVRELRNLAERNRAALEGQMR